MISPFITVAQQKKNEQEIQVNYKQKDMQTQTWMTSDAMGERLFNALWLRDMTQDQSKKCTLNQFIFMIVMINIVICAAPVERDKVRMQ